MQRKHLLTLIDEFLILFLYNIMLSINNDYLTFQYGCHLLVADLFVYPFICLLRLGLPVKCCETVLKVRHLPAFLH